MSDPRPALDGAHAARAAALRGRAGDVLEHPLAGPQSRLVCVRLHSLVERVLSKLAITLLLLVRLREVHVEARLGDRPRRERRSRDVAFVQIQLLE